MKIIGNTAICFAAILLSVPLARGQDLAKYRDLSLGTSLTELCNQIKAEPADASVVERRPALIQDLTWWPTQSYQPSAARQSVQSILFSFYDGKLYKIVVTYWDTATQGLTSADVVRAFSATYGVATVPEKNPTATGAYGDTAGAVALWDDSQDSVTLYRSPLSDTFQLVMFSKQVNGQADAEISSAARQEREDAPLQEAARVKKEADDLEALRQANLKAFRP